MMAEQQTPTAEQIIKLQETAAREARHSRRMRDLMAWERSLGYGRCHWRRYDIDSQMRSAAIYEAARAAITQSKEP